MSDAFHQGRQLEIEFEVAMVPKVAAHFDGAAHRLVSEERDRTFTLQKLGDWIVHTQRETAVTVELKVERKWTGNLFIEAWSNRATMRLGWFHTSEPDWLLYGFNDANLALLMRWKTLRDTLWNPREYFVDQCRFIRQSRHEQANDTWGWLVPVDELRSRHCIAKEFEIRPSV